MGSTMKRLRGAAMNQMRATKKRSQRPGMGTNRTGIATSPVMSSEMIDYAGSAMARTRPDGKAIANVRIAYAREAEPIGSLPPPASLKQLAKSTVRAVAGGQPNMLIDKLGERLAFERTGTRLYQALISKHDAYGSFDGGPSRQDLEHVRDEERAHFDLLRTTLERLGGDPTAVTPSANLAAVASRGLEDVLADPRTSLAQCLETMLIAELVDVDAWDALIELARPGGDEELLARFQDAEHTEQEHLEKVRTWVARAQGRDPSKSLAHVRTGKPRDVVFDEPARGSGRGGRGASGRGRGQKRSASPSGREARSKRPSSPGKTRSNRTRSRRTAAGKRRRGRAT